ncbi:hypothetical protein Tco_0693182 [Tanacetum coccineum]
MSERYFIHAYDQTVSKIIDEVVEETYKTFSETVRVENIRKYEENEQAAQKLAEEIGLEYEEKQDMGAHIAKLESSLNELKMAMCQGHMGIERLQNANAFQTIMISHKDTLRKRVLGLGYGRDTGAKKCLVGENDETVVLQALEIEIRINPISDAEFTEETDIQEKDKVKAKNRQSRARNGNSVKRSQIRAKSQSQKSTKVNPGMWQWKKHQKPNPKT